MRRKLSIRAGEGTSWLRGRNKECEPAPSDKPAADRKQIPYFVRNDEPLSMDLIAGPSSSAIVPARDAF
jgi:hypothetical protein